MTGKLLAYHLKSPRVPLLVRVPQFENHCSMVTKRKFSNIAKLSVFKSVFVPILTFGYES